MTTAQIGTTSEATRFLTKREARTRLAISSATLDRWLREKKLRAFREGRIVRIPEQELARFAQLAS